MSSTKVKPVPKTTNFSAAQPADKPAATTRAPARRGEQRSLAKVLWYESLQVLTRIAVPLLFRYRCGGRERLRFEGAGILISNHQSHFDPVMVGVACDRRLNYLARESLFKFPPLRWLIRSLDAIPIDREGSGLGGLKETLKRLKRGELVLIFAEGTRTPDGEVHALKPGFVPLARRACVPLVPVGIDGAFEAWPRTHRLPRLSPIRVEIGTPLDPEHFAAMSDEELLAEMHRRVSECQSRARRLRRRAMAF